MLKTVKVTGFAYKQDGTPASGTHGSAILSTHEIDNYNDHEIVVPMVYTFCVEDDGYFEFEVWPNERGTAGSYYTVRIFSKSITLFDSRIVVPDVDHEVDIEDIINQEPYPPIDSAQQALIGAQKAATEAKGSAEDAEGSSVSASESAKEAFYSVTRIGDAEERANTSADNAKVSEEAAKVSETNAKASEDSAAASEQVSITKAGEASQSATNAATSETNAKSSETAAASSETQAQISAQASATSAQESANSATSSAEAATASRNSADNSQASANAAAVSSSEALTSETNASVSETNAANSATSSSESADTASSASTSASESASYASISESNAADSATEAGEYADSANTSATTATTKAAEASTSATNASTSANQSSASASASAVSAQESSDSATDSQTSATASATSAQESKLSAEASETSNQSAIAQASTATSQASIATEAKDEVIVMRDEVISLEQASEDSAELSKNWAIKMSGLVEDEDYSSKYYADKSEESRQASKEASELATQKATDASISATESQTSAELSQDWAVKVDGTVDGDEYSAKHYAQVAGQESQNAADSEDAAKQYADDSKAYSITSTEQATISTTKAGEASTSASNALTSEQNSKTSEINSAISENNADTSASNAKDSEDSAKTSATNALNSANDSATKASEASGYAINAETSATTAAGKADEASGFADDAKASATTATNAASAASTSETNAAASESVASTKASEASASATTASDKATIATNKASDASSSATAAANSASDSATSATQASTSATEAATSESNAAGSATTASNALGEVTTLKQQVEDLKEDADTSASAALASQNAAKTSETNSKASETEAAISADSASSSASAACDASDTAQGAATTATNAATAASESEDSASGSASSAESYKDDALSYLNKAKDWATKLDTPVEGDDYSSKYWAQYAEDLIATNNATESDYGLARFGTQEEVIDGVLDNVIVSPKYLKEVSDTKVDIALIGVPEGVTPLGENGKIPSSYLPSSVDQIDEIDTFSNFPEVGETDKIYVALDTNRVYRWGGSKYVEISPSPGSTDEVVEGSANLYFTHSRAANAAPVQSVSGRDGDVVLTKSDVGLGNVNNTSDLNKPISTATQSALDTKTNNDDSRLSNSREWTASTVSQSEAEAGTSTTRRAWTAQRVHQAANSWWGGSTSKTKLDGIATGATKNATDAQLRDRATHTGVQPISTISGLQTELDSKASTSYVNTQLSGKVDKVVGKGLSTEDFTTAEKGKLADLENFDDSDIQAELDTKVDKVYGKGLSDENYTLAEKNKLSGIQAGATANATNAQLRDRATHTGVQPIASVEGLQGAIDEKVDKETGKSLISTADIQKLSGIEAGAQVNTVTSVAGKTGNVTLSVGDVSGALSSTNNLLDLEDTATAKTNLGLGNVDNTSDINKPISASTQASLDTINTAIGTKADSARQIVAGNGLTGGGSLASNRTLTLGTPNEVSTSSTSSVSSSSHTHALSSGVKASLAKADSAIQASDLGTAAYRNVGETSGDVMEVGAFGLGVSLPNTDLPTIESPTGFYNNGNYTVVHAQRSGEYGFQLRNKGRSNDFEFVSFDNNSEDEGGVLSVDSIYHSGNFNPASKANTSTQIIAGTGLTGGGTLAANRTLNVAYGTTAGTAAQGNDSRLSNSREWTAAVVTQAEAEAGTATTARKWTAQRVAQAISALGLTIGTTATTAKAGNWMPTWANVTGKPTTFAPSAHTHILSDVTDAGNLAALSTNASTSNFLRGDGTWVTPPNTNTTYSEITTAEIDTGTASTLRTITGRRMKYALDKKSDTGHGHVIGDVTGLQAALDSKTNTSTQVIAGTGLLGGGTLADNRTLSVSYGTAAGTSAQGNDSRIVNAVQTSRTITAGNGLSGGGSLAANRTVTLGTPSTLTGSTTNAVTSTSHTHEINVTKGDVGLGNVLNVASYSKTESDARYYTQTTADSRYAYKEGDTSQDFSAKDATVTKLKFGTDAEIVYNASSKTIDFIFSEEE